MGTWNKLSGSVVIELAELAPNVTLTGASVGLITPNHNTVAEWNATIHFPASLGTLQVVEMVAVSPTGKEFPVGRYELGATGFVGSGSIVFAGHHDAIVQTGANQPGWALKALCYNTDWRPSPNPAVASPLTIPAGAITGLTGTDSVADRWVDANRSVYAPQTVAITCGPMTFTLWRYDGSVNRMEGWFTVAGNTTWKIGLQGGKEIIYAPPADQTQYLKAAPGAWQGSDADGWRCADLGLAGKNLTIGSGTAVPGLYVSAGHVVAGMAKPTATEVTALTLPSASGGTFPRHLGEDVSGNPEWGWASMIYSDVGVSINVKSFTMTMQDYGRDAGGNLVPIGIEHEYGVRVAADTAGQDWGNIQGPYGSVANPPRTLLGTAKNIEAVGIRVYACSRKNDGEGAWQDPTTSTLQTSIGTGGLLLVTVAVGGAIPSGKIPATRLDATTLDPSLVLDASTGKPRVNTTNPVNGLYNGDFENGLAAWSGWLGTPVFLEVDTAQVKTGHNSCGIPSSGGGSGGYHGVASDAYGVRPGDERLVEAWVIAYATPSGSCELLVEWYDANAGYLGGSAIASTPVSGTFTTLRGVATAPAGASYAHVLIRHNSPSGFWYVDNVFFGIPTAAGDGMQRDTATGGVKWKPGKGHRTGADGSAEVNPGTNMGFDGSDRLVLPDGTLGEASFVGGALGNDLAKWATSKTPFGYYNGLPAKTSNVPSIIINMADSPWRTYYWTGAQWKAPQVQPGDLVAGAITALVSLTSPTINGGSISGTSVTCTNGSNSISMDPTNFLRVLGPSGFQAVLNWLSLTMSMSGGWSTQVVPSGFVTRLNGSQGYAISPGGISVTDNVGATYNSVNGLILYAKAGGGSGTIQVAQGIITSIT